MFDSSHCRVTYSAGDKVVFLEWKKFSCAEDYRKPTLFALDQLEKHAGSNFIIDARNGFEDDKADVEWAFSELLPAMSKTTCKVVLFVMNEISEIEAEMDMWTREFGKYFEVFKARSYNDAIALLERKTQK